MKNGAIRGPTAPTKIELNPLIAPTGIKEDICFSFFDPFKNKYQIINKPMSGLSISTLIVV